MGRKTHRQKNGFTPTYARSNSPTEEERKKRKEVSERHEARIKNDAGYRADWNAKEAAWKLQRLKENEMCYDIVQQFQGFFTPQWKEAFVPENFWRGFLYISVIPFVIQVVWIFKGVNQDPWYNVSDTLWFEAVMNIKSDFSFASNFEKTIVTYREDLEDNDPCKKIIQTALDQTYQRDAEEIIAQQRTLMEIQGIFIPSAMCFIFCFCGCVCAQESVKEKCNVAFFKSFVTFVALSTMEGFVYYGYIQAFIGLSEGRDFQKAAFEAYNGCVPDKFQWNVSAALSYRDCYRNHLMTPFVCSNIMYFPFPFYVLILLQLFLRRICECLFVGGRKMCQVTYDKVSKVRPDLEGGSELDQTEIPTLAQLNDRQN